jgi:hypothetical protein
MQDSVTLFSYGLWTTEETCCLVSRLLQHQQLGLYLSENPLCLSCNDSLSNRLFLEFIELWIEVCESVKKCWVWGSKWAVVEDSMLLRCHCRLLNTCRRFLGEINPSISKNVILYVSANRAGIRWRTSRAASLGSNLSRTLRHHWNNRKYGVIKLNFP